MNGKGIMYYKSGNKYEGDWVNDNKEGKGTFIYIDGDKYVGDYKDDNKHGKGIYYYKSGNKYEGDWNNDVREGKGISISEIIVSPLDLFPSIFLEIKKDIYLSLLMEINMKENIKMIKEKEKESFIIKMEVNMMEIG